jgi:hypothetical protein
MLFKHPSGHHKWPCLRCASRYVSERIEAGELTIPARLFAHISSPDPAEASWIVVGSRNAVAPAATSTRRAREAVPSAPRGVQCQQRLRMLVGDLVR